MEKPSPIRPTDDEARELARNLLSEARFGALGVLEAEGGAPMVSRIAVSTDEAGVPVTLISVLSQHTKALRDHPACSLLVGEPGERGDPLTHPRLTIQAEARFVAREGADHAALRDMWLDRHPKAKLYIDFGDFGFVRLAPTGAYLNGGFGKAFILTPGDLLP
ncbi:HugZ family pyridoxamine 5'-phosphate oxidase [Ovoidimarina sediminis]|uniref:HugZ family pyridoxamine 5'-phosphate oxidase n=1 Tax=Ovoidimarina sediminis TaxID=3079856 RepID=UPI002911C82C|nr:pyridoxamine 5'-phosphate oxidase family protein [Rhodophyticola sp. MJ-SS7]MDU8943464.1 pyridoxamine 5'-phosphate oxidase family protein [Rhodophyticola sp. MJ-SS7]